MDRAFKEIKAIFGGNQEFILSGSSALRQDVRKFLQVCSCAPVAIGYGLTETCVCGLVQLAD